MRVAVTGATGFFGRHLLACLTEAGHEALALVRDADRARERLGEGAAYVVYDPLDVESVAQGLEGADAIVNLAGESLFRKRWSRRFKKRLVSSRVETTETLVKAAGTLARTPDVLLSASAVGIYGPRTGDEAVDESTLDADQFGPADFLANLGQYWERAALEAELLGMRVVLLRIGVILGRDGGALKRMAVPFRFFLGGRVGSGRQVVSWIHVDDACRLVVHALETPAIRGPLNVVAPNPVPNRKLSKALGRALGRASWLPVPSLALRLLLGEAAGVVTKGQCVLPRRAKESGFSFEHPSIDEALLDLYAEA